MEKDLSNQTQVASTKIPTPLSKPTTPTEKAAEQQVVRDIKRTAHTQALGTTSQTGGYDHQSALINKLGQQLQELNTQTHGMKHTPKGVQNFISFHIENFNAIEDIYAAHAEHIKNHGSIWAQIVHGFGQGVEMTEDLSGQGFRAGLIGNLQTMDDTHAVVKESSSLINDKLSGETIDAKRLQDYWSSLATTTVRLLTVITRLFVKGNGLKSHKRAKIYNNKKVEGDTNNSLKSVTNSQPKAVNGNVQINQGTYSQKRLTAKQRQQLENIPLVGQNPGNVQSHKKGGIKVDTELLGGLPAAKNKFKELIGQNSPVRIEDRFEAKLPNGRLIIYREAGRSKHPKIEITTITSQGIILEKITFR